jgi:hypothetical protein
MLISNILCEVKRLYYTFLRTLIMVNNVVSSFPIIKYIINWMSQVLIPTLMSYPLNHTINLFKFEMTPNLNIVQN